MYLIRLIVIFFKVKKWLTFQYFLSFTIILLIFVILLPNPYRPKEDFSCCSSWQWQHSKTARLEVTTFFVFGFLTIFLQKEFTRFIVELVKMCFIYFKVCRKFKHSEFNLILIKFDPLLRSKYILVKFS